MAVDSSLFRKGMRQLAGGVTLITTRCRGIRGGLTATAVCSVSALPPQLLICVNKEASAHDLIRDSGIFCVNVLGTTHLKIAGRFAGQDGIEGDERFQDREWDSLATGAPILPTALASFDCRVSHRIEVDTHTIYIGGIEAVAVHEGKPLMYADGQFVTPERLAHEVLG